MKALKIILSLCASIILLSSCFNQNNKINSSSLNEIESFVSNELFIHNEIYEYNEMLDKKNSPFIVNGIYFSSEFDYNNDNIYDYTLVYALYSQFQFVVFDGERGNILFEELIMMDFNPSKTVCEIYFDGNGNYGEKFTTKIQKTVSSGITETVQIIVNSESNIFEAVYDDETGEFVHCYEKYNSFEEYSASQDECLKGYNLIGKINWDEYIFSKENS